MTHTTRPAAVRTADARARRYIEGAAADNAGTVDSIDGRRAVLTFEQRHHAAAAAARLFSAIASVQVEVIERADLVPAHADAGVQAVLIVNY